MEKATERLSKHPQALQRKEKQRGNMGLELPASFLIGKSQLSKLGASSRSQTVIHQQHPCQIAVNSKLGKDALDAENKTGLTKKCPKCWPELDVEYSKTGFQEQHWPHTTKTLPL